MRKDLCIFSFVLCIISSVLALLFAKGIIGGTPYSYKLQDDISNKGKRAIVKIDDRSFATFVGPNKFADNPNKMAVVCDGYGKKAKFTIIYGESELITKIKDYSKYNLGNKDKIVLVGTLLNPFENLKDGEYGKNLNGLFKKQCQGYLDDELYPEEIEKHPFVEKLDNNTVYLWLNVTGIYEMPFLNKALTILFLVSAAASFIIFIVSIVKGRLDEEY